MWKCDKYAPLVDKRAARCDSIIILQATSFGHVGVIITNKRAERLAAFTGFHRQCKLRFTLCASLRYGSDFFLNRNCCASAALAVWAEREKKIGAHAEEEAQCCIKCRKRRQRRVKNDETGKKKKSCGERSGSGGKQHVLTFSWDMTKYKLKYWCNWIASCFIHALLKAPAENRTNEAPIGKQVIIV